MSPALDHWSGSIFVFASSGHGSQYAVIFMRIISYRQFIRSTKFYSCVHLAYHDAWTVHRVCIRVTWVPTHIRLMAHVICVHEFIHWFQIQRSEILSQNCSWSELFMLIFKLMHQTTELCIQYGSTWTQFGISYDAKRARISILIPRNILCKVIFSDLSVAMMVQ